MVQYCKKCGKELDDDAEFCDKCGFEITKKSNKTDFTKKLPIILAIIAVVLSIVEGLSTPMLMGYENILISIGTGIIGGIIGILLIEKLDEPLIGSVELIATGALIFMFIGRFGEIAAILFIVAAILTLYLKGYYSNKKKLWAIPVLTIVLIFAILIGGGIFYQMNASNSITVGNVSGSLNESYGYYDGDVSGDIFVGTNFDYLTVTVDYYDNQGTIIYSTIAWNSVNPENGKSYKFDGKYFGQKVPTRAEVKVLDSTKSTTPLYSENVTLPVAGGV